MEFEATDGDAAMRLARLKFGEDAVISLWNEDDASSARPNPDNAHLEPATDWVVVVEPAPAELAAELLEKWKRENAITANRLCPGDILIDTIRGEHGELVRYRVNPIVLAENAPTK